MCPLLGVMIITTEYEKNKKSIHLVANGPMPSTIARDRWSVATMESPMEGQRKGQEQEHKRVKSNHGLSAGSTFDEWAQKTRQGEDIRLVQPQCSSLAVETAAVEGFHGSHPKRTIQGDQHGGLGRKPHVMTSARKPLGCLVHEGAHCQPASER